MHKAKTGGEWGANGEFYEGGKFVADSKDWQKRLGSKTRHRGKIETEPGKWIEVSDREQILSIFEIIEAKCEWGGFPRRPVKLRCLTYENYDIPFYREILKMYLSGHRTLTLREYCELSKKHEYTTYRVFHGKTTECSEILKELENDSKNQPTALSSAVHENFQKSGEVM